MLRFWPSLALALVSCGPAAPSFGGTDTSVSGSWTVGGSAPTETSCAALGITTVRIGVDQGGPTQFFDRLTTACSAGHVDSMGPILAGGTYRFTWQGVSSTGAVVAQGNEHTITATVGGQVMVPSIDFSSGPDPRGTDATVSAHWTIGGMAPTSTACSALGIATVRVAVVESTGSVGIAALTSSCTAGVIDTRPMPVLAAGTDVLQLQALDAHGAVVFSGAMATTNVPHGPAHVALYGDTPVDFGASGFDPRGTDVEVAVSFTLDHQMPAVDLCDAVGVSTVGLVLYDPSDTAMAHGVRVASGPCSRGMFDSGGAPVVRAGSYLAALVALDSGGAARATASWGTGPVVFTSGMLAQSPVIDFTFPTTLAITLDWEIPMSTGTGTCMTASVGTMTYALTEHGSGTVIAQQTMVPCADTITIDAMHAPTLGSAAGYDLNVHGVSVDMGHAWASPMMQCSNFSVASHGITFEACVVASL